MKLRRHPSHRCERAFTIIELLVVMLIIAILLGIGMYGVGSARKSGQTLSTVSAAQAYADAADRFAREHNGNYPTAPGVSGPSGIDWASGVNARRGPKSDMLGTRGYYLRTVPEPMQQGNVVIGAGTTVPAGAWGIVDYQPTSSRKGYTMTVTVRNQTPCLIVGGDAPETGSRCSVR